MASHSLNIASLCTGGGGLDLGVELAVPCARPVLYVEREAWAAARLVEAIGKGLMADAPVWSDATTLRGRAWRGVVDWVIGGIPCQPHSLAGKRLGDGDERDLWSDTRRFVVQARPWGVLIENVPGMLSAPASRIAGAHRVWRDLQRLGFAVEGGLFSAAEVGASHGRERLFILGLADPGCEQWGAWGAEWRGAAGAGSHAQPAGSDGELADAGGAGLEGRSERDLCGAGRRREGRGAPGIRGVEMAHARHVGGPQEPPRNDGEYGERPAQRGRAVEPAGARTDGRAFDGRLPAGHAADRGSSAGHAGAHPSDVVHAERSERRPEDFRTHDANGQAPRRHEGAGGAGEPDNALADADIALIRRQPSARQFLVDEPGAFPRLFPPGPGDLAAWGEIGAVAAELLPALSRHDRFRLAIRNARDAAHGDPARRAWLDEAGPHGLRASLVQEIAQRALRGVADGMAARVDELRLLGNGVVSLEGAYALRTLLHAHAARGHAAAAQLVRVTP